MKEIGSLSPIFILCTFKRKLNGFGLIKLCCSHSCRCDTELPQVSQCMKLNVVACLKDQEEIFPNSFSNMKE
ncbi:unnamed protein product [Moneuplotes crassus]|uniref:Uncharacterized protein n=1 Tax=Euplotes crassus TaxID=5936 RepID=A0AAD1Y9N3_EUPCR|nr:unnamed protein product [Moneuplotes crassus]